MFGCLCYPNLLPQSHHNLAPRSTTCVFLGYPTDHRGYRCFDLTSSRIIFSRHVYFDENTFPFHQSTDTTSSSSVSQITTPPPLPISRLPNISPPPLSAVEAPPPPPMLPTHSMVTRSQNGIVKPRQRLCLHTAVVTPCSRKWVSSDTEGGCRSTLACYGEQFWPVRRCRATPRVGVDRHQCHQLPFWILWSHLPCLTTRFLPPSSSGVVVGVFERKGVREFRGLSEGKERAEKESLVAALRKSLGLVWLGELQRIVWLRREGREEFISGLVVPFSVCNLSESR